MQQISVSCGRFKAFDWSCHWWMLSKSEKGKLVSTLQNIELFKWAQCLMMQIKMRKLLRFVWSASEADLKPLTKTATDRWCQKINQFSPNMYHFCIQHFKSWEIFNPDIVCSYRDKFSIYERKKFLNISLAKAECPISPQPMFCTGLIKMFIRLWLQPLFQWESCRWGEVSRPDPSDSNVCNPGPHSLFKGASAAEK